MCYWNRTLLARGISVFTYITNRLLQKSHPPPPPKKKNPQGSDVLNVFVTHVQKTFRFCALKLHPLKEQSQRTADLTDNSDFWVVSCSDVRSTRYGPPGTRTASPLSLSGRARTGLTA